MSRIRQLFLSIVQNRKSLLIGLIVLCIFCLGFIGAFVNELRKEVKQGLEKNQWIPPLEIWGSSYWFQDGQKVVWEEVQKILETKRYSPATQAQLEVGEYKIFNLE